MAQEEWRKPIPPTRISKTQKQAEDAFLDAWSEAWGEHLQQLYAQAEEDFEQEMIKDVQNIGTDQEGEDDTDAGSEWVTRQRREADSGAHPVPEEE